MNKIIYLLFDLWFSLIGLIFFIFGTINFVSQYGFIALGECYFLCAAIITGLFGLSLIIKACISCYKNE